MNTSATVPPAGSRRAVANTIAIWDDGTALEDIEEAVKQAARDALQRIRQQHGRPTGS